MRVCPGNHQQPLRDWSKAEGGEDQKTDCKFKSLKQEREE